MYFLDQQNRKQSRFSSRLLTGGLALGALLAFGPVSCAGQTLDDGPDGNESGGSGPGTGGTSGSGGKTSGGGAPGSGGGQSGGAPGSSDGGASMADGGAAGETGAGGQGGASAVCELPFEGGDCDAAIPVYYHNAQTGLCEPNVYGGCGGNKNRFETHTECESACDVIRTGVGCEVNGLVYPDGASGVPDPRSCNTCSCDDGEVTGCTKIACPEPCPEGTLPATECAECGPTDACLTVRHTCLPECEPNDFCAGGGFCSLGVCRGPSFCG